MPSNITNLSTGLKALNVNSDTKKYGTFAEIGAGQEVARHFFQAGHASGTIAKSMSAYDMVFSDQIYGKENSGRYVCQTRLDRMLDHEYDLLNERLSVERGNACEFFAFANTVATNSGHGWVGIKFQSSPKGEANTIKIHVKMHDNTSLQQAEVLGVLGVNLIYGAFNLFKTPVELIESLMDSVSRGRVDIDYIRFEGPAFSEIDNRLMCLELVKKELTQNVVFDAQGRISTLADEFFNKPVFVLRGEFRPITKVNIELLNLGQKQFEKDHSLEKSSPLLEITMSHLKKEKGSVNNKDFLDRVDSLKHLNLPVMISNYNHYFEVKESIREFSKAPIGSVIGGNHLERFFDYDTYAHLKGGSLEGASRLFDKGVSIYIFPYKTKDICQSLKTYFADPKVSSLVEHLTKNGHLADLTDCDEIEASVLSSHVRSLLVSGDDKWKELVPENVRDLIEKEKLFNSK